MKKMLEKTLGTPDKDAYEFVNLAKEDVKKNNGYFAYHTDQNDEFKKCIYLSQTMIHYSKYFLDTVIVDATYKRNRFNLILVNIVGFNNHGQNIMLGFGLLTEETVQSYEWIFKHLKQGWNQKEPDNFICDESEAIINGNNYFLYLD